MVRGKPSSRLDRGVDIPITLSLEIGFYMLLLINTTTTRDKVGPSSHVVGESAPIHKPERKANGCLGTTLRCFKRVLGLPGQVNKFDSNRPVLTVWDCLISLPHRVTRATLL